MIDSPLRGQDTSRDNYHTICLSTPLTVWAMGHADPHPYITYRAGHYGPCRPVSRFHHGLAALVHKGHSLASPPQCHRTEGTGMGRKQPAATQGINKKVAYLHVAKRPYSGISMPFSV